MPETPTPEKIVKRALTGIAAIFAVAAIFGAKAYEIEHRMTPSANIAQANSSPATQ